MNADTIREMHRAFREGGRTAILKVMRQQPAIFLKLLVLLVPRELEVTRSGGVKSMSDEQFGATGMRPSRCCGARFSGAIVIEALPEPEPLENSETSDIPAKRTAQRKRGKDMGTAPEDAVPE